MVANKEIYLEYYSVKGNKHVANINDDITILLNDDSVTSGILKVIENEYLIIYNNKYELYEYKDIKDMADSDWLDGEDIKEC